MQFTFYYMYCVCISITHVTYLCVYLYIGMCYIFCFVVHTTSFVILKAVYAVYVYTVYTSNSVTLCVCVCSLFLYYCP